LAVDALLLESALDLGAVRGTRVDPLPTVPQPRVK
jgi:hypothetical protein